MKSVIEQAMRFGVVGVVNTAVGLSIIWALMYAGVAPLVANALGYAVGLAVSFTLNRHWTFSTSARSMGEAMPRFLTAFAIAWGINAFVLTTALRLSDMSPYALQIVGMAVYSAVFFVLCRIWVFPNTRDKVPPGAATASDE